MSEEISEELKPQFAVDPEGSHPPGTLAAVAESMDNTAKRETRDVKPELAPAPAASSSWGGWFSSVSSYVAPTVSSIANTTGQLVRDFVVEDQPTRKDPPVNQDPQAPAVATMTEITKPFPRPEEHHGDDNGFFGMMDSGLNMLGGGVDALGNTLGTYLNTGYNRVQNMNINEIQTKLQTATIQVANMAAETGNKLTHQGVDALELVGKSALDFLTVKEEVKPGERKARIRPVFYHYVTLSPQEEQQFEEKVNKDYFSEASGVDYLRELEALSLEMSLKFQKMEKGIREEDRETLTKSIMAIEEMYNKEEEDEQAEESELEQVDLNEAAVKHQENIANVAMEGLERVSVLVGSYEQDLSEFTSADGTISVSPVDICHLTASTLDKILMEGLRTLSQLSAASVAQLLKVAESFQTSVEGGALKLPDVERQAVYMHQVSQKLSEELSRLSAVYNDNLRSVGESGVRFFEKITQQNKEKASEGERCTEDIDNKTNAHANHVYLETSNAVSNIQDCRKFLFAVSKTLILQVLLQSAEVEEKATEEVKKATEEVKKATEEVKKATEEVTEKEEENEAQS
ncbi:hypothetical protein PROFUN_11029 [Planoprotostelium fungivorum]|uniref:DUF7798 domain-containing protein n=1 Tax=Planoprotostelium fungivorum TaxID=1890364 RepID=A0A2P6NBU5_9EUKA|nr:hypothetical protein PROFUN_11029 [Planoprotostelium fungivorum]